MTNCIVRITIVYCITVAFGPGNAVAFVAGHDPDYRHDTNKDDDKSPWTKSRQTSWLGSAAPQPPSVWTSPSPPTAPPSMTVASSPVTQPTVSLAPTKEPTTTPTTWATTTPTTQAPTMTPTTQAPSAAQSPSTRVEQSPLTQVTLSPSTPSRVPSTAPAKQKQSSATPSTTTVQPTMPAPTFRPVVAHLPPLPQSVNDWSRTHLTPTPSSQAPSTDDAPVADDDDSPVTVELPVTVDDSSKSSSPSSSFKPVASPSVEPSSFSEDALSVRPPVTLKIPETIDVNDEEDIDQQILSSQQQQTEEILEKHDGDDNGDIINNSTSVAKEDAQPSLVFSTNVPDVRVQLRMISSSDNQVPSSPSRSSSHDMDNALVNPYYYSSPQEQDQLIQETLRQFFYDLISQTPHAASLVDDENSNLKVKLYHHVDDHHYRRHDDIDDNDAKQPQTHPVTTTSSVATNLVIVARLAGTVEYQQSDRPSTEILAQQFKTFFSFWGTDDLVAVLQVAGVPVDLVWVQVEDNVVGQPSTGQSPLSGAWNNDNDNDFINNNSPRQQQQHQDNNNHGVSSLWTIWLGVLLFSISAVMVVVGLAVCRYVRDLGEPPTTQKSRKNDSDLETTPPLTPTTVRGVDRDGFACDITNDANDQQLVPREIFATSGDAYSVGSLSQEVTFRADFDGATVQLEI